VSLRLVQADFTPALSYNLSHWVWSSKGKTLLDLSNNPRAGWRSGNARFEYRPGHQLLWDLCVCVCKFPQSLQVNASILLQLGHDHFLPNPSQFIIHVWPHHSTLGCVATESVVTYSTQNNVCGNGGIAPCILNLALDGDGRHAGAPSRSEKQPLVPTVREPGAALELVRARYKNSCPCQK
jgi:hypothetical protein